MIHADEVRITNVRFVWKSTPKFGVEVAQNVGGVFPEDAFDGFSYLVINFYSSVSIS